MADTREVIHTDNGNGGMGFLFGAILLIAFLFFLFYYGIPALQQSSSSPSIEVPREVDVNVQEQK